MSISKHTAVGGLFNLSPRRPNTLSTFQVLLHAHDPRINPESQRVPHQGLVAIASLHLDGVRGGAAHLATGRVVAAVPEPVHVL